MFVNRCNKMLQYYLVVEVDVYTKYSILDVDWVEGDWQKSPRKIFFQQKPLEILTDPDNKVWVFLASVAELLPGLNASTAVRALPEYQRKKLPGSNGQRSWCVNVDGFLDIARRRRKDPELALNIYERLKAEQDRYRERDLVRVNESYDFVRDINQAPPIAPPEMLSRLQDFALSVHYEVSLWKDQVTKEFMMEMQEQQTRSLQFFEHIFQNEVRQATQEAKDTAIEAGLLDQRLKILEEENARLKEELEREREQGEMAYTSQREYIRDMLEESKNLRLRLEEERKAKKVWERRARRWGQMVIKKDAQSVHDDVDLYDLKEGEL